MRVFALHNGVHVCVCECVRDFALCDSVWVCVYTFFAARRRSLHVCIYVCVRVCVRVCACVLRILLTTFHQFFFP